MDSVDKKITLFLVDDNALYLKNLELSFRLKQSYYNIVTFATGELCLESMALNPDIIILDYYLNSIQKDAINGLETLIKIRAINPNVPVIMLSVETNAEVAQNCLDNRANEFIIKSDISFARLREIITVVFIDKQNETKNDPISHISKAILNATLIVAGIVLSFFYFL